LLSLVHEHHAGLHAERIVRRHLDIVHLHLNELPVTQAQPLFDCLGQLRQAGKIRAFGWSTDFPGRVKPSYAKRLASVRECLQSDGRSLVQGALCWLWARSGRTLPIPGFRTPAQVGKIAGALRFGPLALRSWQRLRT
jgi:aryl-alcohol dehydrogenase-like predicted oxidoreductase